MAAIFRVVRAQVNYNSDEEQENSVSSKPTQTLHDLAQKGESDKLSALILGKGAKINEVDAQGHTPLFHALGNDKMPTVKLLIKLGALLNDTDREDLISSVVDLAERITAEEGCVQTQQS